VNFTIVVPAFNEAESIDSLFQLLADFSNTCRDQFVLLIVENGSSDLTRSNIEIASLKFPFLKTILLPLEINEGYGGAVKKGIKFSPTDIVMIFPADGKYKIEALNQIASKYRLSNVENLMVKGNRSVRNDPKSVQLLSFFYTFLANRFFRLSLADVNGLPKIFNRSLIEKGFIGLPGDACFDAGLVSLWKTEGGIFVEIPVKFTQQSLKSTSWAGKRLRVSFKMFFGLLNLLKQKLAREASFNG